MSDRERDRALGDLADGRLQVLTSCDLVSEGTDIPVVGAAILLRPTKSTGLFIQQIGRCLRPYPGKSEALVLDMVGNVMAHGMPDADRPWSLLGGVKGQERAVTATRRCRHCYRVHELAERCIGCGRAYPVRHTPSSALNPHALAAMPGIGEFSAQQIATMNFKALLDVAQTERDLLIVARIRGYKQGWVRHVMMERGQ